MTRAGRVVQVKHVLTAMLVYLAMATELPTWQSKLSTRLEEDFF
jgi:hypothetical protein